MRSTKIDGGEQSPAVGTPPELSVSRTEDPDETMDTLAQKVQVAERDKESIGKELASLRHRMKLASLCGQMAVETIKTRDKELECLKREKAEREQKYTNAEDMLKMSLTILDNQSSVFKEKYQLLKARCELEQQKMQDQLLEKLSSVESENASLKQKYEGLIERLQTTESAMKELSIKCQLAIDNTVRLEKENRILTAQLQALQQREIVVVPSDSRAPPSAATVPPMFQIPPGFALIPFHDTVSRPTDLVLLRRNEGQAQVDDPPVIRRATEMRSQTTVAISLMAGALTTLGGSNPSEIEAIILGVSTASSLFSIILFFAVDVMEHQGRVTAAGYAAKVTMVGAAGCLGAYAIVALVKRFW